ncbi:MAG: hypothetical protein A3H63_00320 [Candidatus Harrisonbacteria bacterium RIFCSPLOWO2_02_FULL_45_10c]|uniref:Endolytic murein transglycosylase n=1 Tax=Candidatus Harrisonbacteria bacterium RIFCSPLOWO2_02_FULL_45_10c TaxID=1798410 RepID=A0A1G1ZU86_9BACT|nr:MAG: hypothetical protein A3H63_00320 [Candidatus Harrisonbacteria bacterium RIFCSPLOWO2_02_FULL_45_10c]
MYRVIPWLIFAGCVSLAVFLFFLLPVSRQPEVRPIEISSGMGVRMIADRLEELKIIRSSGTFLIFSVFSGSAHILKPGNYQLSPASSTPEIISFLSRGPKKDIAITFPEGVTLRDIDFLLSLAGVIAPGTLINFPITSIALSYPFLRDAQSPEGFLFPDTYRFFINSQTSEVIEKFLDAFKKKAWPMLPGTDFKNKLIIASMIEKEVPEPKDRRIVSGILHKRLNVGMPLQVDATITYIKCQGSFVTCAAPKIARRDISVQSRYNTYLYPGLPPGPISNPGVDAIKASLQPVSSDYWFYLSDPITKRTVFSVTLEEHNDNRAKYLGL